MGEKTSNLIEASQQENHDSMLELVERFNPLIFKYKGKCQNEDMESILIEHLLRTVLNMPTLSEGQCISYISTALRNKYIDTIKKDSNYKSEISLENTRDIEVKGVNDDLVIFQDMLSVLDKRKLCIVTLKFQYDYSDCEIGEMLSISRQAVNKHLRQAYKIIRTSYLGEGK